MNKKVSEDLEECITQLYERFNEAKEMLRDENPAFYRQWKSGGFLIDENIMSMFPCLSDVCENE